MDDSTHVNVVTGLVAVHSILGVVKHPRLSEVLLEHRSRLVLNKIHFIKPLRIGLIEYSFKLW